MCRFFVTFHRVGFPKSRNAIYAVNTLDLVTDYTKVIFTKTRPPTTNKFIPEEAVEEAFKNEVTAYTQVVPALNSFLSEPLAVPKCIYASKDVIALEDLTCTGFADMHQTSSLSLDMTENVLKVSHIQPNLV